MRMNGRKCCEFFFFFVDWIRNGLQGLYHLLKGIFSINKNYLQKSFVHERIIAQFILIEITHRTATLIWDTQSKGRKRNSIRNWIFFVNIVWNSIGVFTNNESISCIQWFMFPPITIKMHFDWLFNFQRVFGMRFFYCNISIKNLASQLNE